MVSLGAKPGLRRCWSLFRCREGEGSTGAPRHCSWESQRVNEIHVTLEEDLAAPGSLSCLAPLLLPRLSCLLTKGFKTFPGDARSP